MQCLHHILVLLIVFCSTLLNDLLLALSIPYSNPCAFNSLRTWKINIARLIAVENCATSHRSIHRTTATDTTSTAFCTRYHCDKSWGNQSRWDYPSNPHCTDAPASLCLSRISEENGKGYSCFPVWCILILSKLSCIALDNTTLAKRRNVSIFIAARHTLKRRIWGNHCDAVWAFHSQIGKCLWYYPFPFR